MENQETRKLDQIIWREDLYPRVEPSPELIQRYAQDLEILPEIEINQHNEIIDGYHRWTAHRKNKAETIKVFITHTVSDSDLLARACESNSKHGWQMQAKEKRSAAIRLFADGTGLKESEIARILSVKPETVSNEYLSRIKKDLKEERNRKIAELWLACWTEEEISKEVGCHLDTVSNEIKEPRKNGCFQKSEIFSEYREPEWTPPIYNVWKRQEVSNSTKHPGNSEISFLDRLLYLYTKPFDIVVDPFGGGGSTIDLCKKRLRRYWVSDRLPIVERNDIRKLDIAQGPPPLHKRWGDVSLLYLDPPYWKQTEGVYSKDKEDLANMSLEDFYDSLSELIRQCSEKMRHGSIVSLMIAPTQWNAPNRSEPIDHVFDLMNADLKNLIYVRRISAPYESQQCNAQMVDWAKANKELLVISREIIIWKVA